MLVLQLLEAGRDVVLSALYVSASITEEAEVAAFLGSDLDKRLVKLICSVVLKLLPVWRKASVDTRVAMPRLVDVDWRVDVKTSAEALTRMSVPTLLVDMKVRREGGLRCGGVLTWKLLGLAGARPAYQSRRHACCARRQL